MKKILTFLLVLLLAVAPVLALEGPGTILVGDDNERASNPDAEDEGARDTFVTVNFDITNDGTDQITGLTAVLEAANGFSDADLNATITFNKDILEAGETATGTITARIPETLDAIDEKREDEAFHVGDLKVTAGSEELVIPVNMQRENNLLIMRVYFCIDGDCERIGRSGDRVEVKPGDDIEVRVEVENRYSDGDAEDVDFEDVELRWEIDDNDFDVYPFTPVSGEPYQFDLHLKRQKCQSIKFRIKDDPLPVSQAASQEWDLDCVADVAGSLFGTFFILSTEVSGIDWGFWYDDQANPGSIPPPAAITGLAFIQPILISAGDAAFFVAIATRAVIDVSTPFSVGALFASSFPIIAPNPGLVDPDISTDGDTGHTLITQILGENAVGFGESMSWSDFYIEMAIKRTSMVFPVDRKVSAV